MYIAFEYVCLVIWIVEEKTKKKTKKKLISILNIAEKEIDTWNNTHIHT